MMNRIDARFHKCRQEGRAALVTYVMAGDPDPETSLAILRSLPGAGADLVEVEEPEAVRVELARFGDLLTATYAG